MINLRFKLAKRAWNAGKSKITREFLVRMLFFVIGFSPIMSLSLSTFNLMKLSISGPMFVLPAILTAIVFSFRSAKFRREVRDGFFFGLIAVSLYDCTRMPFVMSGLWPDFIPKIGKYLLENPHAHWSIGYTWRYIGNGGGMGLAFCMLFPYIFDRSVNRIKAGLIYGVVIYVCLLITVYASPSGTVYLFKPYLLSASVGLVGHMVYGSVLGLLIQLREGYYLGRLKVAYA